MQMITILDEDHVRFISGICEITKINVHPPAAAGATNTNERERM